MHILNIIADRLLEKESIDSQELDMIFKEKSKSEDYAI